MTHCPRGSVMNNYLSNYLVNLKSYWDVTTFVIRRLIVLWLLNIKIPNSLNKGTSCIHYSSLVIILSLTLCYSQPNQVIFGSPFSFSYLVNFNAIRWNRLFMVYSSKPSNGHLRLSPQNGHSVDTRNSPIFLYQKYSQPFYQFSD